MPAPAPMPLYDAFRPLLFGLAPESAHFAGTAALNAALLTGPSRAIARSMFQVRHSALETERFGIRFPNPVGLAAGFDKSG